jgi:hypothetical protein
MNHMQVQQKRFRYELPIPVHQLLICSTHAVANQLARTALMHSLYNIVCVPSRSIKGRVARVMLCIKPASTFSKPHSATNESDLFG